jgi:hypothetical protein
MIWHPFLPADIPAITCDRRPCALTGEERAALLRHACSALRLGRLHEVQRLLDEAGDRAGGDAACLNLRGVVCEARAQRADARRYYGRAIRADRRFAAAQQNMRRLYESDRFGHSAQAVAVGEPFTDLWLARRRAGIGPPGSASGRVE